MTSRYYGPCEKRDNRIKAVSLQNLGKGKGKADGKYVSTECEEKLAELIKTTKAEIAEIKKAANA